MYDREVLFELIQNQEDETQDGKNMLGYVLASVCSKVKNDTRWSGNIHLFMPTVPADDEILLCKGKNIHAIRQELEQRYPNVHITVHSVTQRENQPSETLWYDEWSGIQASNLHFSSQKEKKETAASDQDNYVPPAGIRTGAGGVYIKIGGREVFVGRT
jgi:hypothetical protein